MCRFHRSHPRSFRCPPLRRIALFHLLAGRFQHSAFGCLLSSALTRQLEKPIIRWKGFSHLESYVRFPISQITAFMLLIHLGLGCCWHHAHTCTVNYCESPAQVQAPCGCDAHAHNEPEHNRAQRGDDTPSRNDDNPHRHSCDGDRCWFVRSDPSPKQKSGPSFDLCSFDVIMLPTKSELFHSRQTYCQDPLGRHTAPPVRAHLLFSVQLI